MLGRVFSPLGRTDCPEHTMGWVLGAKNWPGAKGFPTAFVSFVLYNGKVLGPKGISCSLWVAAGSSNIFVPGGGWSSAHQLPPLFLRGHSCHPPVVITPGSSSPQLHPLLLTRPSHC